MFSLCFQVLKKYSVAAYRHAASDIRKRRQMCQVTTELGLRRAMYNHMIYCTVVCGIRYCINHLAL